MSFKINFKDTFFHISINSKSFSCFTRMLVEFSLKLVYSTRYVKNFQIYGAHIHRKCIESRYFYLFPLPFQNSPQSPYHHNLGRGKLLIPPGSIFSKIYFPQQLKGVEESMICFINIHSENMEMTWNIRLLVFCIIYNFFKCNGVRVL